MKTVNKRATEYLKDFWYQSKQVGGQVSINMDDLLADAKAMGRENLKNLMIDFYNYEIYSIIDI